MKNKDTILVTAVGAPPGLNALRALRECGRYRLIVSDADEMSGALYLEDVVHRVLPKANASDYLEELEKLVRAQTVQVIIPCIEEEVLVMSEHKDTIQSWGAALLLPAHHHIKTAVDKENITRKVAALGIACPQTIRITAGDTRGLREFQNRCPLPWILKPVQGHGMRGVEKVDTLQRAEQVLADQQADFLAQEFIPGGIGSMHLVGLLYDAQGVVIRRFSSRSIRTLYPGGGPATAGVSRHLPELISITEKIFEKMGGWLGPVNVEWMLDPRDNQFKFIEANPRLWGYGYLAVGAGVNFPVALAEAALGRPVEKDPGFRDGVTMIRVSHDMIFSSPPFPLEH